MEMKFSPPKVVFWNATCHVELKQMRNFFRGRTYVKHYEYNISFLQDVFVKFEMGIIAIRCRRISTML